LRSVIYLVGKLLRHIDGVPSVLFGSIGGLVEKLEHRLTVQIDWLNPPESQSGHSGLMLTFD
jgi:hypothetical protein